MPGLKPGPICSSELGADWIDDGTLCHTRSSPPGTQGLESPLVMDANKVCHLAPVIPVQPAGMFTPARNLTPEEARDLTVYYASTDQLHLAVDDGNPTSSIVEKPVAFGRDGKPTFPKVGQKVVLTLRIGGANFTPANTAAKKWRKTYPIDMRLAVLCVRLVQFLEKNFGEVKTIYWGGMGIPNDNPISANKSHENGWALDFHGVETSRLGLIMVNHDWGMQKVILPNLAWSVPTGYKDPPPPKGTKVTPFGPGDDPWLPKGTTVTKFRLSVDTVPGAFFYDVYNFLTSETVDRPRHSPTSIGNHSYILHPDSPDPRFRPSHWDHIHCQIDL